MFSADLPAGKLSEVSEICFDYTALFEGISYRRFYSKTKENTSLSSAVVLRFFLLLCLLCRGLVKFFFLVTHKKFCGCFVNLWWQYYDFFFYNSNTQIKFREPPETVDVQILGDFILEISFISFIPFRITLGARILTSSRSTFISLEYH